MRRHGWSGAMPASDEEAIQRIVEVARRVIDESGPEVRITDVARKLGVTRQTVYRYFPSTEALLAATALSEVGPFLDRLAAHLHPISDPAEAVVEGIAHTLERLPEEKYLRLLLTPGRAASYSASVTSDVARALGRSIIDRFNVDWDSVGITDDKETLSSSTCCASCSHSLSTPDVPRGAAPRCATTYATGWHQLSPSNARILLAAAARERPGGALTVAPQSRRDPMRRWPANIRHSLSYSGSVVEDLSLENLTRR